MTDQRKPTAKLFYLGIEAAIWANPKTDDTGFRYSVTYSKNYKDSDGEWQSTNSLSEIDNLKLGVLYLQVAEKISELKAGQNAS